MKFPDWLLILAALAGIFLAVNVILFFFINWLGGWGLVVSLLIFTAVIVGLAVYDRHIFNKRND